MMMEMILVTEYLIIPEKEFNKDFLGKIPLNQDLRNSADKGDPLTHLNPDHEVSKIFKGIAEKIRSSINKI